MIGRILSGVGNVLDLPGSMVRDAIAMQNPFDQVMTPFSDENRTSGRGLLRQYGLAGNEDTWGNWAGGMAAEMALDPTNLIGGGFLKNAFKGLSKAKAANAGIDAANALSRQQRAMGFMPEEIAQLTKIADPATGMPQRVYHGSDRLFDQHDMAMSSSATNWGPGIYNTTNPSQAELYAYGPEANIRMSYVDMRKPLETAKDYMLSDLSEKARASPFMTKFGDRPIPGKRIFNVFKNELADVGYDGVVHKMADATEVVSPNPSQIYKPYIAKKFQNHQPLPTGHKSILKSMMATNALSRGGHRQ